MATGVWELILTVMQTLGVTGVALTTLAQACLWRRTTESSSPEIRPRVSVLKPLCGVDPDLPANLRGFGRQDYQDYEIVFGLAEPRDPALPIAREFARSQPALHTKVSLGQAAGIPNPKVALLQRMQHVADGEWLVISDSNVRVRPSYLSEALRHAGDPQVGLITHRVVGAGGSSWAARCENVHLNCFVAPIAAAAQLLLGHTCVIGKSIFVRRDVLEKLGGFQRVGAFLAEDYMLGQLVEQLGFRVVTAPTPVTAWHADWTFERFFSRHARWAVMRRRISLAAYALEGLSSGAPWLLLALLLLTIQRGSAMDWLVVIGGLGLKYTMDALSYRKLSGSPIDGKTWFAAPLRDVCVFAVWVQGWFTQVVEWRGKLYHVQAKTRVEPVLRVSMQEVRDEC